MEGNKGKRPLKPIIVAGTEIEMTYNDRLLGYIERESYHDAWEINFGNFFFAENDGSLHGTRFSGDVEIISVPFLISNSKEVLKDFENTIKEKAKDRVKEELELKDLIHFNSSCGAHVHMSIYLDDPDRNTPHSIEYKDYCGNKFMATDFSFKRITSHALLKRIKRKIKSRIKEELPSVYPKFSKQYVRSYAKGTDKANKCDREVDWNYLSGNSNHIEFRAFNLNGVETWEEFHKMYEILFSVLETEIYNEINKVRCFEEKETKKLVKDVLSFKEMVVSKTISVRDREVIKDYNKRYI